AFFEDAPNLGSSGDKLDDLVFVEAIVENNEILQYGGYDPRSAVCWGGNHPAECGVFLVDRQSKATHPIQRVTEMVAARADGRYPAGVVGIGAPRNQPFVELVRAAFHAEPPWQHARGMAAPVHAVAHGRKKLVDAGFG